MKVPENNISSLKLDAVLQTYSVSFYELIIFLSGITKKKTLLLILYMLFPLIIFAQEILSIGEVFDFEIGDEFHTKSILQNQPPNAYRFVIIDKYYSSEQDTVYYKIAEDNYTSSYIMEPEPHLEYYFYQDTTVKYYTNLDSSILTYYQNLHYDTIVNNYAPNYLYDTIVENSENYCDTLINGFSCVLGNFEAEEFLYKFGKGLGIIREYWMEQGALYGAPTISKELFFYRKNGIICGTPDNFTFKNNPSINKNISISPNPTCNYLNIFGISKEFDYSIYNMYGQEILKGVSYNSKIEDLESLSSGQYILNIITDSKKIKLKFIKF